MRVFFRLQWKGEYVRGEVNMGEITNAGYDQHMCANKMGGKHTLE